MKNITALVLLLAALIFSGCSNLDNSQRSVSQPSPEASNSVNVPTPLTGGEKNVGNAPNTGTSAASPEGLIKGPRISFISDYSDRGKVYYDTQIEQVFEFRNAGSDVLEVTDTPTIKSLEGC